MKTLSVGPIPLYHQLVADLTARIDAGEYVGGGVLPTEEQLCQCYGVSRITVRKALDMLASQGLILRRRGIGSFVIDRSSEVRAVHLTGSLDEFLATAHELLQHVISMEVVVAADNVCSAFGLAPGGNVLRVEVVSTRNGETVAHFEFFFRAEMADILSSEDIADREPVIRVIERKTGTTIGRALQLIEPAVASPETARHLGLEPGTPLLRARRQYFTMGGELVEIAQAFYHPDRYRYEVELRARPQPV